MINAAIVNTILCVILLDWNFLTIIREAETAHILAICFFSLLWGFGNVGFGYSIQIAGIGLGTTLTMSVIAVIGTLLPLLLDVDGMLLTASGGVIVLGLFICALGFVAASKALALKDVDELVANGSSMVKKGDIEVAASSTTAEVELTSITIANPAIAQTTTTTTTATRTSSSKIPPSSTYKITVCLVAGLFCTMLQFAFVLGEDVRTITEEYVSKPRSSAIIWIFALIFGTLPSIISSLFNAHKAGTLSNLRKSEYRTGNYLKCLFGMSLPWVSHAHLYGISAGSLMGTFGAALGWPLLIVTSNVTGLVVGWRFLGEWDVAGEESINYLKFALALNIFGMGVVCVGGLL